MKREMNKEWLPHIIAVGAFVVFIVLGLACASTPTTQIDLDSSYKKYLQQPVNPERAIDTVGVRGTTSFVCRDPSHNVTSEQQLGASYSLGGEYTSKKKAAEAEAPVAEKHRHEAILDQLVILAKGQYPNEKSIDIRSGRTSRHIPTNPRLEEYQQRGTDGNYYTATRTVWDCVPQYVASVITTELPPNPVTHVENFTKPGSTRDDIYRRVNNWLRDNSVEKRIGNIVGNINDGRLTGTVTCAARAGQTYLVISEFTIDVLNAGTEISFKNTLVQRLDSSQQRIGNPEPVFLQSIADAAKAEIVKFSTDLRSAVLAAR
jgi:hypothetical protein